MTETQTISLIMSLVKAGIPLIRWGQGATKTLKHLIEEMDGGEADLSFTVDNNIIRYIRVVYLNIYYIDKVTNNFSRLIEEKQVFKNGQQRVRKDRCSVAEKLFRKEVPTYGVLRALKEELGIGSEVRVILDSYSVTTPRPSQSYLGLKTVRKEYNFTVYLTENQYKAEGYIEHQKDKDTYFIWT